jgi:peroxiredoxin
MQTNSLTEELTKLRATVGEPWRSLSDDVVGHLIKARVADEALKAGDKCPEFSLINAEGKMVRSGDLLARGPLVLSFYRGVWCPFCEAELEAFHHSQSGLREAGGLLVTVTSEVGGLPFNVKRERDFDFEVLCDLDNGLALAFGLVFRVSDELAETMLKAGIDFLLIYGNDSWFLPIPATYIIGKDGIIAHAYVNADFRFRLDPSEVVRLLQRL